MALDEAVSKSDESGRESAKSAVKTIFVTIGLASVILFVLSQFGLDIGVWARTRELLMSRLGVGGIAVTLATVLLAYVDGFTDMMQKYSNTGKLGGAGLIGMLSGVAPLVLYVAPISLSSAVPLWMVGVGLAVSLGSAIFAGRQKERHERNS